jgi:hypothetical protein
MARPHSSSKPEAVFAAPRSRCFTVLGQDPTLEDARGVVTVPVSVPLEDLAPGPRGARLHIVDCDASTQTLYKPVSLTAKDPFANVTDVEQLVSSRAFHAQHVYGTAMSTLCRFERALGRRVPWSIPGGSLDRAANSRGHVLKVAPHAFSQANAYYSRRDEALLFGYFPSRAPRPKPGRKIIFTCLSQDVVTHETTHALLDGLRPRYTSPSSPDQAAFHEGFADVVALLSGFRHERVMQAAFPSHAQWIGWRALTPEALRASVLSGLGDQLGPELLQVRGAPLRASARIIPSRDLYTASEYLEPHKRGELLVAATMNAFLAVWAQRLKPLQGESGKRDVARERVIEEGAAAADHLLTMAIRALDYAPPVDLDFPDYLTALLTADRELFPDDSRYQYRKTLIEWFGKYGIDPVKSRYSPEPGTWAPPERPVSYRRSHFESLTQDPDEAFHFIWENRLALELDPEAFTYVPAVNRCVRADVDGFMIHETIIQYVQVLGLQARELRAHRLRAPQGMPKDQPLTLYGGGILVFDEFGRLKFHIGSGVQSPAQSDRLESLWQQGFFNADKQTQRRFAEIHRARGMASTRFLGEGW